MSDIIPDTSMQGMVDELKKRGVVWPLGGFSPGRYNVVCRSCARRFDGAKRAYQCLPCAVAKGLSNGVFAKQRFETLELVREILNGALDAPHYAVGQIERLIGIIDEETAKEA
ncbi:MAG: hypothetical protein ABJF67_08015 [Aurantimonas coralicida]